jgi:hypothetical protein
MDETKTQIPSQTFTLLLFFIFLVTGIHWLVLYLRIPVLDALPYWKYNLRPIPINHLWIVFVFFCLCMAILLSHLKVNNTFKLIGLIVLGTAIQFSLAYSKGQGMDGMRVRISDSGHTEFAKIAVEQPGVLHALRNYETLAKKKSYGYIPSKPPGTLFFYMLTEKISNAFWPVSDPEIRLNNLYTFASIAWPVLSYLALIPLFFLARELFASSEWALVTCLLYIVVPSVDLITLHTDQVLFPLMVLVPVLMSVVALRKDKILFAVLAGITLYLAAYFSFGLAVIGLLVPVFLFVAIPENTLRPWPLIIRHAFAMLLGAALTHLLISFTLNYDIIFRYNRAIEHHLAWKDWENTLGTYLRAGITDAVEFSVWVGLPLILLFVVAVGVSVHQILIRKPTFFSYYSLVLAGIFVVLLVIGKTKAETARLWLFLVPFLCLSVASFIRQQNWTSRHTNLFIVLILFLEMGTTYFTLHYQDFW